VLISPLAFELRRGQVPQRRVDPLAIVDLIEEPSHPPQRVVEVLVLREIDLLLLDRSHDPIGISMLFGFAHAHHADPHGAADQHLDVGRGGILHPLVGMMNLRAAICVDSA
jgi:hypothetical protein